MLLQRLEDDASHSGCSHGHVALAPSITQLQQLGALCAYPGGPPALILLLPLLVALCKYAKSFFVLLLVNS